MATAKVPVSELKITRKNQAEVALAVLQGQARRIRRAIVFWRTQIAAKAVSAG